MQVPNEVLLNYSSIAGIATNLIAKAKRDKQTIDYLLSLTDSDQVLAINQKYTDLDFESVLAMEELLDRLMKDNEKAWSGQ